MTLNKTFKNILILSLLISSINVAKASCIFSNHIKVKEIEIGNIILWETIQEIQNDYFIVQKSVDNKNFETVSVIKGAVNSEESLQYQFLDAEIGEQKVYYRLLLKNLNGEFEYTPEVVHERRKENNLIIQEMSSFEVERYFSLTLESKFEGNADYHVSDEMGRFLYEGQTNLIEGKNAISFNLADLTKGKYQIVVEVGEESEEAFIYKLKSNRPTTEPDVAGKNKKQEGRN